MNGEKCQGQNPEQDLQGHACQGHACQDNQVFLIVPLLTISKIRSRKL